MARTLAFVLLVASGAAAQAQPTLLATIGDVQRACNQVAERDRAVLYAVDVQHVAMTSYLEEERALFVDTHRNLSAIDGHLSLMPAHLEPIYFEADPGQADRLRREGTSLRLGFFLGFDDPAHESCLVRSAAAVSIVRFELAFAELRDAQGRLLARFEGDRLRAWTDDAQELSIEGHGPRGAVGAGSFADGQAAPEVWQRALASSDRNGLARCHIEGIAHGAAVDGRVIVRLNVETRTGRIRRADVAMSSLGNAEEADCIAHAVGSAAHLSAAPSEWRAEVVDLEVPVRLTSD